MGFTTDDTGKIIIVAKQVRFEILQKYNNTFGKCIIASDEIVRRLQAIGYKAEAKQVWCLYEKFENCTDYCYEEHWIVKITKGNSTRYVDVTMDQFQWAFTRNLPTIYVRSRMPNFYLSRKPGKVTLDRCGWNNWYNYGDYENNFNYYN